MTVRLLDPPLHEFLPDQVELAVEVALAKAKGEDVTEQERVLQKVNELHEIEPDARPPRRAPGHHQARAVRDAGARDRRGGRPGARAGATRRWRS